MWRLLGMSRMFASTAVVWLILIPGALTSNALELVVSVVVVGLVVLVLVDCCCSTWPDLID